MKNNKTLQENEKNNTQKEQKNSKKVPLPKEPEKPKLQIDLEDYSISIDKIKKALEK